MNRTQEIADRCRDAIGEEFADQISANVAVAVDSVEEFDSVESCYHATWQNALEDSPIKRTDDNCQDASWLFDALWVLYGGPAVPHVDFNHVQ